MIEPGTLARSLDQEALRDRVIGGMTPRPSRDVLEVCKRFSWQNIGDPQSYSAARKAAEYIVEAIGREVLGRPYPGWVTSGSSEGNLLALYAAREAGYRRVVYTSTAHYSIPKAARILGMRPVQIPAARGYMPRMDVLEDTLAEGDVVVATVGTTETGYIDPLAEIVELASTKGAIVHVDAAFAGPIMRWLPTWRIPGSLEGIATIVMDLHKLLEAPPGAGVILASSRETLERLFFEAPYIPSGRQFGVLGTRGGGPIVAGAYALSKVLAGEGLHGLAARLIQGAGSIVEELEEWGYTLPHGVEAPILCLIHPRGPRIHERLEEMGYKAYRCQAGRGVRLAVMPHTLDGYEAIIGLLREAARGA